MKRIWRIASPAVVSPSDPGRRRLCGLIGAGALIEALNLVGTLPAMAAAAKKPPARSDHPRQPVQRRRVVIDPGHGGNDPGTIGARGSHEKEVTLTVARELRRQLLASQRYDVALTREHDEFVSLADRVQRARASKGELFLSLHADAIHRPDVRGASVYTLSEKASDARAAALAAKENRADAIAGLDLSHQKPDIAAILVDLVQRETKNQSATFANILLPEMGRDVRLLDRGHRFAGFAVLKAPDIPSVLVEMGYLSNREDERLLNAPAHQARLAATLVRAIGRFFDNQSRAKA
ncbi:MAG: N-acetylmuramoyl-L-alanine amidase [Alphaproteobacteria bacterium]|nr:N-acetylmuramoyl-L-alanine amidase [Alphaproteobacteria bacterium]